MPGVPVTAAEALRRRAIQEGFILDVLKYYTAVESYYRLLKTVEDDPKFDTKRAQKKLRRYVESHEYAIRQKAEIMIDHFHDQVIAHRKIGGGLSARNGSTRAKVSAIGRSMSGLPTRI
jgi:hypothetical protein